VERFPFAWSAEKCDRRNDRTQRGRSSFRREEQTRGLSRGERKRPNAAKRAASLLPPPSKLSRSGSEDRTTGVVQAGTVDDLNRRRTQRVGIRLEDDATCAGALPMDAANLRRITASRPVAPLADRYQPNVTPVARTDGGDDAVVRPRFLLYTTPWRPVSIPPVGALGANDAGRYGCGKKGDGDLVGK